MSDPIVLGYREMDVVHAEFDELLASAVSSDDDELAQKLDCLVEHLKLHFAMEEEWMLEGDFPPRECHAAEHAAVLQSAAEVQPMVARGNLHVGRSFIRALANWFPPHATHLDSALAAWMCKRQSGGKPLVFHRRIASID
ncbi:hemerythrin-like metal-binding domain protein [Variovorax sp. HW608]|uniref:hemerythrin domain-containing protein n=1 Tax=Variovorax sp. HW608 TaxID=1034889 RepID=UPI00081FE46C|nr:hemerythrin domain-containing protein [Variovorax sp. HW608]SCK29940.1 hemerythrin-like metal-binding domain protein [Variovorax sp. HW608]